MVSRTRANDRLTRLTFALLLLVTIAAWADVIVQTTAMVTGHASANADMSMGMSTLITPADFIAFVAAWVVMMAAMMLPSAAPVILLYQTMASGQARRNNPFILACIFVLGYLAVWAAFGVVIYLAYHTVNVIIEGDKRFAQWALYGVALVLLVAGAFQFTAFKRGCLRACQSPLGFLMAHWRSGPSGAFRIGLEHGLYCTGCCWGLMAVLVAAGAMSLAWVLSIALVVAAEKLLPRGQWAAWIIGVALLGLGVLIVAEPQLALVLRGPGM